MTCFWDAVVAWLIVFLSLVWEMATRSPRAWSTLTQSKAMLNINLLNGNYNFICFQNQFAFSVREIQYNSAVCQIR